MKTIITKTMLTLIGVMFFSLAFAQDYTRAPKENERVIGSVTESIVKDQEYGRYYYLSYSEMYPVLLEKAKKEYPNKVIDIRDLQTTANFSSRDQMGTYYVDKHGRKCSRTDKNAQSRYGKIDTWRIYTTTGVAKVIEFISPETKMNETLVKAIDKAMNNVRASSRCH